MDNKDFVARVVNGIKGLSKDSHISKRYILGIGRTKAKYLMSQKLDELSLFKEDQIISRVECFRLKPENIVSCDIVEFRRCDNLMKSVNQIPETIFGKVGAGIIALTNIDGTKEYTYSTPNAIINKSKRRHSSKVDQKFFYVRDGYLYLPNSTTELVNIDLFAIDEGEVEAVSECSSCSGCTSAWDSNFVCPDRFMDLVLRETIQEVATIYRTSIEDENPNLDSNIKSQTQK